MRTVLKAVRTAAAVNCDSLGHVRMRNPDTDAFLSSRSPKLLVVVHHPAHCAKRTILNETSVATTLNLVLPTHRVRVSYLTTANTQRNVVRNTKLAADPHAV